MKINTKVQYLWLLRISSLLLFFGFWAVLFPTQTDATAVPVDNVNLVWSPYTWVADGSNYKQSPTTGAYLNVAFSGDTLALNVDDSFVVNGVNLKISAFIDGSSTPIDRTLADVSAGRITFTTSLGTGNHYAHIVIMHNTNTANRWNVTGNTPTSTLRITSVEISNTGSILSLAATPLAKKDTTILFYGDSITEGNGINGVGSYYATAANVGRLLDANYGTKGYASSLWYFNILSGVQDFYYSPGVDYSKAVWNNYYQNTSLLNNVNDPTSGYIEGAPDAVYNNLGVNDSSIYPNIVWGGEPARLAFQSRIENWLPDVRQALGGRPAIFMVIPYAFSCTEDIDPSHDEDLMALYKQTYTEAYDNYIQSSGDTRAFLIDIGSEGCRIPYEDGDGLHPSATGAADVAGLVVGQTQPRIILQSEVVMTAVYNNEEVTNGMELSQNPTLRGTALPGTTITLSLNGGSYICTVEADETGEWSCTFNNVPADSYSLSVTGETEWGETINFGTFSITLLAAASDVSGEGTESSGNLAQSGANMLLISVSAVLLLLGGAFVLKKVLK